MEHEVVTLLKECDTKFEDISEFKKEYDSEEGFYVLTIRTKNDTVPDGHLTIQIVEDKTEWDQLIKDVLEYLRNN